MIQVVTYAVAFLWCAVLVLSFMDYLLGIDKLNPIIEKYFNKFDSSDEVLSPIILTSFLTLPCIAMYFFTSSMFFYALGAISAFLSLGMFGILVAAFGLIKLVEYIRNYFISLKKQ